MAAENLTEAGCQAIYDPDQGVFSTGEVVDRQATVPEGLLNRFYLKQQGCWQC